MGGNLVASYRSRVRLGAGPAAARQGRAALWGGRHSILPSYNNDQRIEYRVRIVADGEVGSAALRACWNLAWRPCVDEAQTVLLLRRMESEMKMPRFTLCSYLLAALALSAAGPAVAAEPRTAAEVAQSFTLATRVPDGFTITAVGDMIISRPLSERIGQASPEIVKIFREADVLFGNFETTAVDLGNFRGAPQALSGGGWLRAEPQVPRDLRKLGFQIVNRANNHATDWGVEGMLQSDELLDEAGIVHAGTGRTLRAARSARYLELGMGSVSLVSATATYTAMQAALDPVGEIPGRPGASVLRLTNTVLVSPERLAVLAQIRDSQPAGSYQPDKEADIVTLFGTRYQASGKVGNKVEQSFAMNPSDRAQILRAVKQGKEMSNFMIFSLHAHTPGNYSAEFADFHPVIAHEALDNGADVVFSHGPHQVRGIEIYKGKPIFYSLGNFIFMENSEEPVVSTLYETFKADPATMNDAEFDEFRRQRSFRDQIWYESVVATLVYRAGAVREIRLFPVELNWDGPHADRGIPRKAPTEIGQRILQRLQTLSAPLGTKIEIENGLGVIRL